MSMHPAPLPIVDVVIPNYNYGHYLLGCANSVLSQTGVQVRLLIIDNASNDDSCSIALKLAANDRRVEVVLRPKNLGPHASFNEAIDWASSDYFLILCADDFLAHGALSRAINMLEQYADVHLAHGVADKISEAEYGPLKQANKSGDEWTIRSGSEFINFACKHAFNPVAGPTAVVRTAVQKRVGYYRPTLKHTDDLEMWLRFSLHGSVASTQSVQAYARVHAHNQSATVAGVKHWNTEFEAAFRSFFDNEGRYTKNAEQLLTVARKSLSKRAYWSALSHLARFQADSTALMLYALKRNPLMAVLPPIDYLLQRSGRQGF